MAGIDSISESAPIDIEVMAPQGPRGRDAATTVVTGNFTAVNDYQYNVMASAVATDPTGVEGKGYTVFVINGTATVGGVAYPTEGTVIRRYFKSGTWYSKVYKDSTAYATASQGTDERVPTAAGLTSKFGTAKSSIVDNDRVAIFDSAAANAPKHTLWSVVKSTLKTYFDTVYAAIVHTHVSAQITDASTEPVYNESTELYDEVAALYSEDGELNAAGFITEGGSFYSFNGGDFATFSLSGSPLSFKIGTKQFRFNQPVGNGGQYTVPDGSGTLALTSSASGAIVSADISDATTTGQANRVIKLDGSGGLACVAITASGAISTTGAASHISTSNANAAVMSSNFLPVESGGASLKDGSYNACLTWGQSGRNLTIPSGVAVTIDATNFTLGAGTASAFKNALDITDRYVLLTNADLVEVNGYQGFNLTQQGVYVVTNAVTSAWEGQIVIPSFGDGQYTLINQSAIYGYVYDDNNNEISDFDIGKRVTLIFADSCWQYSISTPNTQAIFEAKTNNGDGRPSHLHDGAITGTTTFNTTTYTYTTGAAAAHRTALGLGTIATQDANAVTLSGSTTFNSTSYTYGTGAASAHRTALGVVSNADLLASVYEWSKATADYSATNVGTGTSSTATNVMQLNTLATAGSSALLRSDANDFRAWQKYSGSRQAVDWSKKTMHFVRISSDAFSGADTIFRIYLGLPSTLTTVQDLQSANTAIGFKVVNGAIFVQVSNGSAVTTTTTGVTMSAWPVYDCMVQSNGDGTWTATVNGTTVTGSGAPTTTSAASNAALVMSATNGTTAATRRFFINTQRSMQHD